ncbi:MAG TPA: SDR family oxidoreductase, partial [Bryobacteraceae bacterium]|nr:SDR family oxidoreductase [Bryobacteraceae bacterium]
MNTQRTVVITGATGGLGGAVVQRFEQAGDLVIGIARNVPQDKGWIEADLLNGQAAEESIRKANERTSRIDVLVHVLGGFAGGKPTHETGADVWEQMVAMNATAAFHVIRATVELMRKQGSGRIIAIGS